MTNLKATGSRPGTGRSGTAPSSAAASAASTGPAPDSPRGDKDALLEQLVALTRSIQDLVQQNSGSGDEEPLSPEETRAVFAYDFLGVVLGRRAPRDSS